MNSRLKIWIEYNFTVGGRSLIFILLIGFGFISAGANPIDTTFLVSSKLTNDTYVITVNSFGEGTDTISVIYTDASKKTGETLKRLLKSENRMVNLIGITHVNPSKNVRRRDFIPETNTIYFDSLDGYSGSATQFVSFLRDELLPLINPPGKRVFVGHSFGGVLAIFLSISDDSLFDHAVALSPSIWLNQYRFVDVVSRDSTMDAYCFLNIVWGEREGSNRVKSSCRRLQKETSNRFSKVRYFEIIQANHYNILDHLSCDIIVGQ